MQAKILDFASDKLVKSLGKIEKDDILSAYSSISSKFRKDPKVDAGKVSSHDEYCDMLKNEFNFDPNKPVENGVLSTNGIYIRCFRLEVMQSAKQKALPHSTWFNLLSDEKDAIVQVDETSPLQPDEAEKPTTTDEAEKAAPPKDAGGMANAEIQSFVQKKSLAQGRREHSEVF